MTSSRISATNLLRETFATTGPIYAPLLTINFPNLILSAINSLDNLGSVGVAFNIIYWFVAIPLLSGAMIFYTYRSLTRNQVTVGQAFNQANRRLLPLIWVYIMSSGLALAGFIALIIPGLYVSYRLIFSLYATVIDNSSALDSLSSSWELTKGRWWLVFRASFLIIFVVSVPIVLMILLISSTANLLASKLAGNLLGFLAGPLMNVYLVLLYQRLRESAATIK
ncbi:glycerophosphoryl diester phosphodiesterase membrane domain-containing protein [Microcoleus sp. B9-D4]|uniref:glycerophosphoryl diester phosphodiesterase membrane domain-containing protein n=1 Tax=Microcoleus sp. B9-D4 TaxID=2818711 RepID=UPI002FD4D810